MGHTHRYQFCFKKKKNQVVSPSPESRVPETGSDPPIGSARDSGRDNYHVRISLLHVGPHIRLVVDVTCPFIPLEDFIVGLHCWIDFRIDRHGD